MTDTPAPIDTLTRARDIMLHADGISIENPAAAASVTARATKALALATIALAEATELAALVAFLHATDGQDSPVATSPAERAAVIGKIRAIVGLPQ